MYTRCGPQTHLIGRQEHVARQVDLVQVRGAIVGQHGAVGGVGCEKGSGSRWGTKVAVGEVRLRGRVEH